MPDKTGRLNRQERVFAQHYAASADATYAATKAGYSSPQPRGAQNLAKPAVMEEARRIALQDFADKILPAATKVHLELLTDRTTPPGVRAKAVDLAYKYGLAERPDAQDKAPSEMTASEIQARLAGLEATRQRLLSESADRAKPVIEGSVLD